ncbi:hypothetical protein HY416_04325 [Candidatus Kaiserbacteria bacterium]|nr:hypothetical protein [Candidatus Kaiserbacteria bacterium]
MKWYFASRTRHQGKLADLSGQLENLGEEIASQWVYITDSLKPYHEHPDKVHPIAEMDIRGAFGCDVFVLISDPEGTDMFAELGAALAKAALSPEKITVYVVGEHAKRSLIQCHPAITHVSTVRDVLMREHINTENIVVPDFV